jgi:putative inorganic carbon (hco3(-)) transporter
MQTEQTTSMKTSSVKIIAEKDRSVSAYSSLFTLSIIYIFFDYARPQALLPFIGFLRPIFICIAFLTILLVTKGALKDTKSRQTKLFLLFNLLIMAYIPFARNNMAAFQTSMGMLAFIPFMFAVMASVNTVPRLKKFMNVLVFIMIFQAVYALTHKGMGSGNYFLDENDLSLYINMWLPFCWFLFPTAENTKIKALYIIGMVSGLASIVVSFSRGGFVGLIAMGIVAWLYSSKKVISLFVVAIFALMVYVLGGAQYIHEMSTITDTKERTANERILTWEAAWRMFLDNPLGVGGNNFQKSFHRYQSAELKRGMWNRVAHSLWFTLLPELGIFGVIIFFMLLWYNLKDIFLLKNMREKVSAEAIYFRQIALAFLVSLVGFFASATFLSVLYYPHYWYLTAIIVAAVSTAKRLKLIREGDASA